MKQLNFTKMVASGNDFVVIRLSGYPVIRLKKIAREVCDRKFGAGADGLLVLEKSRRADVRMRIFNADGTEAEMCGNGARCSALYSAGNRKKIKIETKAGIIEAEINAGLIKVKLTDPKDLKLDLPVKINNRQLKINFINTGVPHAVIFVEGLDKIDVASLGRQIRYHDKFMPCGTNVDFVEVLNNNSVEVRTYERGVEDETLACGTGSVASALVFAVKVQTSESHRRAGLNPPYGYSGILDKVNVITRSGEILKVCFEKTGNNFHDVWLEGKTRIVYAGVYHV